MKKYVVAILAYALAAPASAAVVSEVEPNNSRAAAQSIDAAFTLDHSPDIGDTTMNTSTIIPHATVRGGPGDGTPDWYGFTVDTAGSRGIFDIDYAQNFDPVALLYDSAGTFLAGNDDNFATFGQGGSASALDSYFEYLFQSAGSYFLLVRSFGVTGQSGGNGYDLQVSIADHPTQSVPEPAMAGLFGFGVAAAAAARRRVSVRPLAGRRP